MIKRCILRDSVPRKHGGVGVRIAGTIAELEPTCHRSGSTSLAVNLDNNTLFSALFSLFCLLFYYLL